MPCKSYDNPARSHNDIHSGPGRQTQPLMTWDRSRLRRTYGGMGLPKGTPMPDPNVRRCPSAFPPGSKALISHSLQSSVFDLTIRLARPTDREDVFAISSTVWEGNDYIPSVWDEWIAQPAADGFLMICEMGGRVVALQHVEMQPGRVAWIEGIRVHERHRNRGIAGQMLARALSMVSEAGAAWVRLSVSSQNSASKALVTRNGFQLRDTFYSFTAPACLSTDEDTTHSPMMGNDVVASGDTPSHAGHVERRTVTDSILHTARVISGDRDDLIVTHGWTAQTVPGQLSPEDFELGFVRSHESPGVLLASVQPRRHRINLAFVGGSVPAIHCLGHAARHEAARLGMESAGGMLRRTPGVVEGLELAGYELRDDHVMIVYERPVP